MKPVLWTTRRLVTSVSVVQRWNQAVDGPVQCGERDEAAIAPGTTARAPSAVVQRDRTEQDRCQDPGRDRRQKEHPVRVGRIQHLLAGLQDFVDITPHTS